MPNWLASELCMLVSFSLGAWKTFKALKKGGADYNLLKTWCLLSLVRVFEEYLEFLVSWIPFYWLGKCCGLALLLVPESNMSTVLFERVVVWGMGNAHHVLNNLVVPNVVEFVVYLPWRLLHVVFPTSPATALSSTQGDGGLGARAHGGSIRRISGSRNKEGAGLAARLQHLKAPTKTRIAVPDDVAKDSRQRRSLRSLRASRRGQGNGTIDSPSPVRPSPPVPPEPQTDAALEGQAPAKGLARSGASGGKDSSSEGDHLVGSEGSPPVAARGVGGGRAGRRRSFGEIVRATLTGDSQTRLRDHLFDLHTASPAPPPTLYVSDSTDLRSDSIRSSSPSADKGDETEDQKSSLSTGSSDGYRTKKALKKPATKHSGESLRPESERGI